jgi:hypothetical protein
MKEENSTLFRKHGVLEFRHWKISSELPDNQIKVCNKFLFSGGLSAKFVHVVLTNDKRVTFKYSMLLHPRGKLGWNASGQGCSVRRGY